jgi:c-di-GMP-related signal transduction protein
VVTIGKTGRLKFHKKQRENNLYSYVARQAILDINQKVVAYELLFRNGERNFFPDICPNKATSNILTDNQLTLGLEKITGDLPAYVNFHTDSLLDNFPSFLDPKKVVIEILEDVTISAELIASIKTLKEKGYQIALDDHDFDAKWSSLLPYIDIIKVDVLAVSILEISRYVRELNGLNVILLAEKVETAQEFEKLKMLGFTLFQGYFFSKPEMLKQKRLTSQKIQILDLVAQSSKPELDLNLISEIFRSDPGLTYRLLRFINSPSYGSSQEITSLRHALIYIGELELKKFIALLALSDLSDGKCNEIMYLSLTRAKFCEYISQLRKDPENPPKAFLTGILSLIDGILDQDIDSVLNVIPIHSDIKAALRNEPNFLSDYLTLAKEVEQGQWVNSETIIRNLGLNETLCFDAYMKSLEWADAIITC